MSPPRDSAMRILIEAMGIDRPGGGRTATLSLLQPLLRLDQRNTYDLVLSAREPSLEGLPKVVQHIAPITGRFASRAYLQVALPFMCRRRGIDVVHFIKNQVVLGTGSRSVVTVYDLTTLRHPEAYPPVDRLYWRHVLPRQFRRMDRVIAISDTTAADLVSRYRLPRERIRVIRCGYDARYRPAGPAEIAGARTALGLDDREYFLHVGNLSLKKNLTVAVEAFLTFRRRTGFSGLFVLAGEPYSKGRDDRFFARVEQPDARASVRLVGHVPQEHLVGLYAGALAFVFPSLHEGFGLAPLEAMACGSPVVAHAGDAVREVVGDAGILLESPTDVAAWSRAIERVAEDAPLRRRMREAGLARAAQFTGERAARQTLALYEELGQTSIAAVASGSRSPSVP